MRVRHPDTGPAQHSARRLVGRWWETGCCGAPVPGRYLLTELALGSYLAVCAGMLAAVTLGTVFTVLGVLGAVRCATGGLGQPRPRERFR